MQIEKIIGKTEEIAREVGKFIALEALSFRQDKVEYKSAKSDLVSYVDKTAETRLVEQLSLLIPDCGFITEENTVVQNDRAEFTWLIDPLDGTTNFVHGVPSYAVSIGLMHERELVGGVVYEVSRQECFSAVKDKGATLNGKNIHVSNASEIENSLFATGFPVYNFARIDEYMAILNELMKNSHGLRRLGSAATDLAYVACGRLEGFFEYNLHPWDVAAGAIIIREAGGIVTDFSGGDNFVFGREIVAGSPVHPKLLEVIQKFW